MFDLTGKTAIITGGGGILGKGFCQALSDAGARVAIVDIALEQAQSSANNILAQNAKADVFPCQCDITQKEDVEKMVSQVQEAFGEIHILFNNAATKTGDLKQFFAPFESYDLNTWREVMSVNLDGMFLVAQAVGNVLVQQNKGGSIIQTSSIYGLVGPDQGIYEGSQFLGMPINTPAVYSCSKGAVISLTRHLATYWAKHNIRVNTLTPGGIESGQNNTFVSNYSKKVPLGRMGRFDELFGALLFLASDASSYVTGQNIVVDGGFTCW